MACRAGFALFAIAIVFIVGLPASGRVASAREDSAFLFPASGDGSYGSPGTTYRGYSFDWYNPATQRVEAAPAGWTGQDASEPPGAGDFAALHDHLINEDPGPANTSFAWAFFDSLTLNPEYGNHPVIPYGPPYAANYVVSPVLEVDRQGRALGSEIVIDDSVSLYLEFWLKRPWPPGSPIRWRFDVAARVEGQTELGSWESDFYDFHPEPGWSRFTIHLSELLLESAEGGNITGVVARLGLVDLAAWYPEQDGPHPPEPFFDNISVWVEEASPAEWLFLERDRFQDNFPEHGGPGEGFV